MATVRICRNPPDSNTVVASSPGVPTTSGTIGQPFWHITIDGIEVEVTVTPDNIAVYRTRICINSLVDSSLLGETNLTADEITSVVDWCPPESTEYSEYTSLVLEQDETNACVEL